MLAISHIPDSAPAAAGTASAAARFTRDGTDTLESHLNEICHHILVKTLELVPQKKLQAILLGGGYGRGEGGVLHSPVGDRPYNDMEFYVFLRGADWLNEQKHRDTFELISKTLADTAEIEIEFKVLSLAKLKHSHVSMFYYDLICGHRWIYGTENLLQGCEHHRQAFRIPASEATRLLMNRCTGLLFVQQHLEHEALMVGKSDFIRRNLAKLQLALGDALLTHFGQYHWSCLERHERLMRLAQTEDMAWLKTIQQHHAAGVDFKLHPVRSTEPWQTLREDFLRLRTLSLQLWLWLENRRLKQSFKSIRDYAESPVNKCPETRSFKNRIINSVSFGIDSVWKPESNRHPRERLLQSLPLLLWGQNANKDPALLKRLQNDLETLSSTMAGLLSAYQKLWFRFR